MKCNLFPFFFSWLFVVGRGGGGGDFGSGSGSKFNCAARVGSGRVGSDDLGYGPGSGFSFELVQTSSTWGAVGGLLNLLKGLTSVVVLKVEESAVHSKLTMFLIIIDFSRESTELYCRGFLEVKQKNLGLVCKNIYIFFILNN